MNLRHLFIATALLLGGCGSTFEASTPPGFVEIENDYDAYDWRVTSADGLVMGVRVIDHDPVGTPEFWLKAIQNSMRLRESRVEFQRFIELLDGGINITSCKVGLREVGVNNDRQRVEFLRPLNLCHCFLQPSHYKQM